MKRNKHAHKGVGFTLLIFIAVAWTGVVAPLTLPYGELPSSVFNKVLINK